jgi:regulator of cell morphogenesis and NO signaling
MSHVRDTEKLNPSATVADLVVQNLNRARVFERFGLDYCCGGNIPLAEACGKSGASVDDVIDALAIEDACSGSTAPDYSSMELGELADHVEHAHHKFLRAELPRLEHLFEHVTGHHGDKHPELAQALGIFQVMAAELDQHLLLEDEVLFPLCQQIGTQNVNAEINATVERLMYEHRRTGDALAAIRRLLNNFTPPEGACRRYLALLHGLTALEADLHEHIHKENNILMPRLQAELSCA